VTKALYKTPTLQNIAIKSSVSLALIDIYSTEINLENIILKMVLIL
jgi:hypothetical protein